MTWNRDEYTDEEWDEVNAGYLCPNSECKSTSIICIGGTPDGMHMNYAYDCITCGQEWEGD